MPLDGDGWYVFPPDGGKLKLEVDLGAGWVNLTPWWAGLQRVSGRAGPLDRFNASTLSFQLDNRDREWCPWRTGPHGKPGRNKPVRLRAATPGGLIVPRFAGWTTKWEEAVQVGVQGVGVTRALVECTDGFRRLARANGIATTPAGAGELSGNRVQRILDAADWDAGLRAIDDGEVTLAATDLSRPALDELQDVALSEGGVLFIDVYGRVTFFDRDTMDGVFPPEAVLGGSIPTGDKRFAEDDSALVNTVRVARTGGTASTAVDATSVAADGQRLWTRTDLPLETDGQATTLAAVLLSRAINSVFLPGPLRLEPISGGADVWDAVVRLQVTNPIAVVHTDQELGSGFTASTRIDGITDDIQPGRWVTTYTHSPLDEPGSYTVVTSITDLACTSTGSSITWTWNIPVHGYDRLWLRLDGGDWFEVDNTLESVTVSGLSPSSSHTLCVRGRLDLVDADQVCGTCTTRAIPGPPDPDPPDGSGGDPGDVEIPPPDPECVDEEWEWTLYELSYTTGVTELDTGTIANPGPLGQWWTPTYAFVAGTYYRLCWQQICDGTPEGDPECWDWQEPTDWEDPCDFPDPTAPDPDPVFWVEACGATGAMRELVSDSVFFPGPLFDGVSPDPNGAVAIRVGSGFNPGRLGSGYYAQIGDLGTFQVVDTAMTVGMWVNFDSEPNVLYPMVRVGTTGDDAIAWALYARGSSLSVGKVKITLSVMTASGPYEIDWDTVGEDDTVPIAGWHTVVVTWGDHDVDGDIARLYIDAVQVGADEALPADWWVKDHDNLLEWRGEPNSETAHLMGWDVILTQAEIDTLFTPPVTGDYDTLVLADDPKAFWPLDAIDVAAGSQYDAAVMANNPKLYLRLDGKQPVTYSYSGAVDSDNPRAFWPLDAIVTI